jgi:hypothetical protein
MLPEQYREYGASLSPFKRVAGEKYCYVRNIFGRTDGAHWVTGQNLQAGGGLVTKNAFMFQQFPGDLRGELP